MRFKLFRLLSWFKKPAKEEHILINTPDGAQALRPVWQRTVCSNKLIDPGKRGYHLPVIKIEK